MIFKALFGGSDRMEQAYRDVAEHNGMTPTEHPHGQPDDWLVGRSGCRARATATGPRSGLWRRTRRCPWAGPGLASAWPRSSGGGSSGGPRPTATATLARHDEEIVAEPPRVAEHAARLLEAFPADSWRAVTGGSA